MTSTASDPAMRAEHFRALHAAEEILVLPDACDAASARTFRANGARAIGTTSMGIAASAGSADVQQIPLDAMRPRVGEIDAPINVLARPAPASADAPPMAREAYDTAIRAAD
jgi:2-methylisocitrate lyase-like PEP mutase family enzyme